MGSQDRSRWDEIHDLIAESDRIRRESERVRNHVDSAMKQPFWPDRRRAPRGPWADEDPQSGGGNDGA